MRISPAGLDLIRHFEGCRLQAYRDPVGVLTIGYGHTLGVLPEQRISQAEAESYLLADLAPIEQFLAAELTSGRPSLTQGGYDALCCFAFNLGLDALRESTLWRLLGEGAPPEAIAAQFGRWVYAAGKVLPGLLRRREAEARMFLS